MAKLLKLRRGTTSQHSSFTGAEGEVTVDTTKDTLVVHDGSTAGGVPLAKESANLSLIDEDNMSTNSATRPPSQQSVKAYVDTADALKASLAGATFTGDVTLTGDSANVVWDKSDNALEFATNANLTLQDQNIIRFTNGLSSTSGGNEGIMFGASGSEVLKIFNTTTGTNIHSTATNGVEIKGPKFNVRNSVPNDIIYSDGAYVKLYYSDGTNSTEKLATSSSGVSVTGSLTISGGLTVNGTTTTVNTTNTTVTDNLLELNSGAGSNANDAGILIERGSTGDNAIIAWDESADKFTVGTTTGTASSTGNISITTGTLVANVEGNVTGNASGTAATVTGAAQSAITSVGTLTSLTTSGLLTVESTAPKIKLIDSDATGTPEAMFDGSGGDLYLEVDKDNEKGSSLFGIKIDGSEKFRIDSSGNVEVKGGNTDFQQQNNSVNTVNGSLIFSNSGTSQVSRITGYTGSSADDGDLRFYTKNSGTETEALRITQHATPRLQLLAGESEIVPSATDGSLTFKADPGQNKNSSHITFQVDNTTALTLDSSQNATFAAAVSIAGDLDIADEIAHIGDTNTKIRFPANDTVTIETAGTEGFRLNSSQNATFAGTVSDSKGNVRSIPANNQGSAYTLVASDAGKHVTTSGNATTVPNSVFSSGDAITLINNSGSDMTITQGSGVTIYNTADSSTGNRTLASRGMATILWSTSSVCYISGAGLS